MSHAPIGAHIKYYIEPAAGDRTTVEYLSVNHATRGYYRSIGQPRMREARAAAIAGSASSVCTTSIDVEWLKANCRLIRKADVPAEWLARF